MSEETKHTPGPWRPGKNSGSVVSDTLAKGAFCGADAVAYYGGNLICESVAPEDVPLIAAAPDMLAALKAAQEAIENYSFETYQTEDALEKIYAAILKAEGRDE